MTKGRLTDRFFAIFGLALLLGCLAMIVPQAIVVYVVFIAGLLTIAFLDRKTLIGAESMKAAMTIPRNPTLSTKLPVEIELLPQDESVRGLSRIEIYCPESDLLDFKAPRLSVTGDELESEKISVQFEADVTRLGYQTIDVVEIGVRSRLGFWFRDLTVKVEPVGFRVAPESREISEQAFSEMIAAQRLLFVGARIRSRSRSPDQYLTAREYQYPDSIRHIDHKKSAKVGQLMTRVFDSFHSHHVVVALDLGRAMCGQLDGSSKHDFYLSAALLIARNAAKSRDHISFFSFARELHPRSLVAKTRNLSPFDGLFRGLQTYSPREEETEFDVINRTVAQISGQRSIVIVMTDISRPSVQESLLETLGSLCRKHIVVVLSLTDKKMKLDEKVLAFTPDRFGTNAVDFDSVYSEFLYDYWANEEFQLFRSRLSRLGGAALHVTQDNWMSVVDRLYALLRNSV